jgi:hypothetical protein
LLPLALGDADADGSWLGLLPLALGDGLLQ